jgi:sugar lactone lactonase YvrE
MWDDSRNQLCWVDIPHGDVHRLDASGTHSVWRYGDMVSAVASRAGIGLVLAIRDGIGLADALGQAPRLVPITMPRGTCMNDAKCDRRGRLWVGSKVSQRGKRGAVLFRIDPSGEARTVSDGLGMANGLGWSPDDRVFYLVDSAIGAIYSYPFDLERGLLGKRRLFAHVPAGEGIPDGLAVDSSGCVWVALWGGGKLNRYTPGGGLDGSVDVPVSQVTSCAFGGADLDRLYVTSARAGLSERERQQQPLAGALFVTDSDVPGTPVGDFGG